MLIPNCQKEEEGLIVSLVQSQVCLRQRQREIHEPSASELLEILLKYRFLGSDSRPNESDLWGQGLDICILTISQVVFIKLKFDDHWPRVWDDLSIKIN